MTNNFHDLITRMANELDEYRRLLLDDCTVTHRLSNEARAALADEPAVPQGKEPAAVIGQPSDEEWDALVERVWDKYQTVGYQGERFMYDGDFGSALDLVRKELSRWGHQPAPPAAGEQRHPMPMLLSERLPGPEDCDAEGRCWWSGAQGHHWELCRGFRGAAHWLPAHALPLPEVGE